MKVIIKLSLAFLLALASLLGYSQNILKNGDFEYPVTDELSMKIDQSAGLPGWTIDSPILVINHTRLFPYSNFQCLLLPAKTDKRTSIGQSFSIAKKGKVDVSFAFAASRLESGSLKVTLDGREIAAREFTDYWVPAETRLTDHMKWVEVKIPGLSVEEGIHSIEFSEESCKVVVDKQGDKRDMIEGFLIDAIAIHVCQDKYYSGIPNLDELAGQTVGTKTLACYPAIGNFRGSVRGSKRLGAMETQFLAGSKLVKPAGAINIDGSAIFSQQSKWYPYQIVSTAKYNGIDLTTTMRMVFEKKAVLMQIEYENKTDNSAILPISMELVSGKMQDLTRNQISINYSGNNYAYSFVNKPDTIRNSGENAVVTWNIRLNPGEKRSISYVLSIESEANLAKISSEAWSNDFTKIFAEAKSLWEKRWNDVFTPENPSYSGYLPTFESSDKNLYEIYYLSIVSFLETQQNKVYPTLDIAFGSNNEWAFNQAYFWEMSQFADMYALLEPKGMKAFIKMCLNVDIDKGNAIDYNTGKIVNHWYAVNDYALFKIIDSYIRINKDFDFLKTECNGKTIFQHLYNISTSWEKRFNKDFGLADYGKDPWSFFEAIPDYVHFVPAMNAQNVWMLRSMAEYDKIYGKGKNSVGLLEKADLLAANVKALYVPGEGVWRVKYPDGNSVISRHSYDFLTIGMTMKEDLSPEMKSEMINFVETELLTQTDFMRAMSLKDQAALNSDRSDHGPVGCYIGWPALTVQAIADLGQFDKAKTILGTFRNAFVESGMGQAIEFLVPVGSVGHVNRIGARAGASFLLSGSDYANAIIDGLMGYKPSINGGLKPYLADSARFFDGKLINIRHGADNYIFGTMPEGIIMQTLKK